MNALAWIRLLSSVDSAPGVDPYRGEVRTERLAHARFDVGGKTAAPPPVYAWILDSVSSIDRAHPQSADERCRHGGSGRRPPVDSGEPEHRCQAAPDRRIGDDARRHVGRPRFPLDRPPPRRPGPTNVAPSCRGGRVTAARQQPPRPRHGRPVPNPLRRERNRTSEPGQAPSFEDFVKRSAVCVRRLELPGRLSGQSGRIARAHVGGAPARGQGATAGATADDSAPPDRGVRCDLGGHVEPPARHLAWRRCARTTA